jgi:formylglycine-generating enzyme required for sulfatase activity
LRADPEPRDDTPEETDPVHRDDTPGQTGDTRPSRRGRWFAAAALLLLALSGSAWLMVKLLAPPPAVEPGQRPLASGGELVATEDGPKSPPPERPPEQPQDKSPSKAPDPTPAKSPEKTPPDTPGKPTEKPQEKPPIKAPDKEPEKSTGTTPGKAPDKPGPKEQPAPGAKPAPEPAGPNPAAQDAARRERRHLRATLVGELLLKVDEKAPPMRFVYVPPGTFPMGYGEPDVLRLVNATGNALAAYNSSPQLRVRVSEGYFILDREVTAAQYALADPKRRPAAAADAELPARGVTWREAVRFTEWLGQRTGESVRLPSEIEWEYAARGPSDQRYPWADAGQFHARAGEAAKGGPGPHDPRSGDVSWRGVYDLGGNVSEWCLDAYSDRLLRDLAAKGVPAPYAPGREAAVRATKEPLLRTVRGGCFSDTPARCEISVRRFLSEDQGNPTTGFRPVLIVSPPAEESP